MFKAVFCKSIWDGENPESSSTVALFQREENLPFTPQPGIEIYWGREKSKAPLRVRWDVSSEIFVCDMEDEFPHWIDCDNFDFEWLISNAVESGWRLISKHPVNGESGIA
jgi:hypothetical protein